MGTGAGGVGGGGRRRELLVHISVPTSYVSSSAKINVCDFVPLITFTQLSIMCGVDRYGAVWYLWCGQVWICVVLLVVWTGMDLCGVTCGVDRYGAVWCSCGVNRYGAVWCDMWCEQVWSCVV